MNRYVIPLLALALLALAAPANAGACPFSKQSVEKPEEKVENPSA